jgi:hypothetical protein
MEQQRIAAAVVDEDELSGPPFWQAPSLRVR